MGSSHKDITMKICIPIEIFKELLIKGQCKEFRQAYQRNRLRILYKKRGDFENMKRVLLRYAEVFGLGDAWVEEQYKRYTKSRKQSK